MSRSIRMYGLVLAMIGACQGQLKLSGDTIVTFATADEGRKLLTTRDDFIRALSPFDRAARLKTDRDVSEKEFLEFVGQNVLDWTEAEKASLGAALDQLRAPLDRLALPWPKAICAVKTTGAEEGAAAYTRGRALILPQNMLAPGRPPDPKLIAHELFHILSRSNPELRERLYHIIGYAKCTEVEFPEALQSRKITNPDAPANDHCIRVQVAGADVWAIPILFSRIPKYDTRRGGEFFRYMDFQFLVVERQGDSLSVKPKDVGSEPQLVAPGQVSGLFEQIGRNTQYVIHPEETLADNFAELVIPGRQVPSPEILRKLQAALTEKPLAKTE
jgi:hypothetical protein